MSASGAPGRGDMTDIIVLDHVEKVYRRDALEIPVLSDITLKVPQGEYLALMGPSGSGKTTLLNLIAGIDQPTRGRILVGGVDISTCHKASSRSGGLTRSGYLPALQLIRSEGVRERELPLLLTKLSRARAARHVETALSIVGLVRPDGPLPRQLSGGQEQRVAIARAIVSDNAISSPTSRRATSTRSPRRRSFCC